MATTTSPAPASPSPALTPTTSTADSSPNPSSSASADNVYNSSSGFFSLEGSPPLIVALLGLGLFAVAMVGAFGWRRMSPTRRLVIRPIRAQQRRRASIAPGSNPKLWEIWARRAGRSSGSGAIEETRYRWENIMPLAAVLTSPVQPPLPLVSPPQRVKSADPSSHSSAGTLKKNLMESSVRTFCSPVLPPPPPPPPAATAVLAGGACDGTVLRPQDELSWGEGSSLQISVAIAMPVRRAARSDTSERDTDAGTEEEAELGEFCIGTTEAPWPGNDD
ncbi:hypothetical protein BU15DRAFT_82569 [Melanogaster broomeanus]|nr:hypothetical protein BU15DRAFT_82569 [Melanogaster broomeanus]